MKLLESEDNRLLSKALKLYKYFKTGSFKVPGKNKYEPKFFQFEYKLELMKIEIQEGSKGLYPRIFSDCEVICPNLSETADSDMLMYSVDGEDFKITISWFKNIVWSKIKDKFKPFNVYIHLLNTTLSNGKEELNESDEARAFKKARKLFDMFKTGKITLKGNDEDQPASAEFEYALDYVDISHVNIDGILTPRVSVDFIITTSAIRYKDPFNYTHNGKEFKTINEMYRRVMKAVIKKFADHKVKLIPHQISLFDSSGQQINESEDDVQRMRAKALKIYDHLKKGKVIMKGDGQIYPESMEFHYDLNMTDYGTYDDGKTIPFVEVDLEVNVPNLHVIDGEHRYFEVNGKKHYITINDTIFIRMFKAIRKKFEDFGITIEFHNIKIKGDDGVLFEDIDERIKADLVKGVGSEFFWDPGDIKKEKKYKIPLDKLIQNQEDEYADTHGTHPDDQKMINNIIKKYKAGKKLMPLFVHKTKKGYVIIDGHHRFGALKQMGAKFARCIIVSNVNYKSKIKGLNESFHKSVNDSNGGYIIEYKHNGVVIGAIRGGVWKNYLTVEHIYLIDEYRSQGHSLQFYKDALELAKSKGLEGLMVGGQLLQANKSRNTYKHFVHHETEIKNEHGEPYVILTDFIG